MIRDLDYLRFANSATIAGTVRIVWIHRTKFARFPCVRLKTKLALACAL